MKKISVIIPLYNAEAYIGQCLRSVTGQTCDDLEILVIDDGSKDRGALICRELAAEDSRIRVLHQENRGVSAARNRGLEEASGRYVFFLDSDDVIHPGLLGKLAEQAERKGAQLAFCRYRRWNGSREEMWEPLRGTGGGQMQGNLGTGEQRQAGAVRKRAGKAELPEAAGEDRELSEESAEIQTLPEDPDRDSRSVWLEADEKTTQDWFHITYTDTLSGIGGKLILREAVGGLRFDSGLTNGEDTFFLYQLSRKGVHSVFCLEEWYYYRIHSQSVTGSPGLLTGKRYFESARRIRDGEYERGYEAYAVKWEILAADQMRRSYAAQRKRLCRQERAAEQEIRRLRQIAAAERKHPLFGRICFSDRVLFICCFTCFPFYVFLNGAAVRLTKGRSR